MRHVPRDVAVHQPRAGVIRLERNDDPPLGRQHRHVAAHGVGAAEAEAVGGLVEDVARLRGGRGVGRAAEDDKVVAVQVEGVREREAVGVVLDEPVGPGVDLVDVHDVVAGGVRRVALHDVLGHGLLPVDVDGGAVDLPDEEGRRRGAVERHVQGVGGGRGEGGDGHVALDDGGQVEDVEALEVGGADAGVGRERGGRAGVAEDGGRGGVVGDGDTAKVLAAERGVEPVVAGGLRGVDGHVQALADGEEDGADGHGVDGDEVGGDDGHLVPDEGELEVVLGRRVDDAQAVALAGLKGGDRVGAAAVGRVDVGAIEEDVVRGRGALGPGVDDDLVGGLVVVVGDGEDAEVDVVRQRSRAVDLDGADDAVAVLGREVGVVPGRAVLLSAEAVLERVSGGDGALGHAVGAVIWDCQFWGGVRVGAGGHTELGALLVQTVPVDGGSASVSEAAISGAAKMLTRWCRAGC